MLARRVTSTITAELTAAGVPVSGDSKASNLNLAELPPAMQTIVRAAYGDATGHIFAISAGIAVVGVLAAAFLRPVRLRTTLDLGSAQPSGSDDVADEPVSAGTGTDLRR